MATPKSRNSHPSQSSSNFASSSRTNSLTRVNGSAMTIDGFLRTADAPFRRTADEVWREIVSGERMRVCKQEMPDEELMTLEDFLVKAGVSIDEEVDVKVPLPSGPSGQLSSVFSFEPLGIVEKLEPCIGAFGSNGMETMGVGGIRGKRVLEGMDRATHQRQKRMIKNRESAARSRERKQAYQIELEAMVAKLEEENEKLLKEKAKRTEERLKKIIGKVIPNVEKPKAVRTLRRVRSLQCKECDVASSPRNPLCLSPLQVVEETGQVPVDTTENEDRSGRNKKYKVNVPMVAGSAILVSVIVLVVNLVRTRRSRV